METLSSIAHLLHPPGIRILAYDSPEARDTWLPHGLDGWYVGLALESYCCYQAWIWETKAIRIVDTVHWFPTKVKMPLASSNDHILAGIKDIKQALLNPSPGSPLAPLTDSHVAALQSLLEILTNVSTKEEPISAVVPPQALPTTAPALSVVAAVETTTQSAPARRVDPSIESPTHTHTIPCASSEGEIAGHLQ
jgi:hypothetical protein